MHKELAKSKTLSVVTGDTNELMAYGLVYETWAQPFNGFSYELDDVKGLAEFIARRQSGWATGARSERA